MRSWAGMRFTAAAGAFLALSASGALAAALSLTGLLDPNDAQDVFLHPFTLTAPATVTIQSYGHGGSAGAPAGRNAAGTVIAAGGFDPYLSVFSGTGSTATFVAANDDGTCPPGTVSDGACRDPALSIALPAGNYTLALSAFLNLSIAENYGSGSLGDGFAGLGSFGTRSNAWAVDISAPSLVVPTRWLGVAPGSITFGAQTVATTSGPSTAIVTSLGSAAVDFSSVSLSGANAGDFAVGGTCGGSLAPAATCTLTVTFTPSAPGPRSAQVTLASNAGNNPVVLDVGGTGTTGAVASASLSATSLDFGTRALGSPSPQQSIVVTNTGGASLVIGVNSLGGANAGDFAIAADGCAGQTLAPALSCTIAVFFTPQTVGPRTASYTINSNASNNPTLVALTGAGATPQPIPTIGETTRWLITLLLAIAAMRALARRCSRSPSPPPAHSPG